MLLHFVFVAPAAEMGARAPEFAYVERMGRFYRSWIRAKFGWDWEVRCDEMPVRPGGLLRRLDTPALVRDHERRGRGTYHFYLTHFRPLWTDCTCEGYHAENFGLAHWQRPGPGDGGLFLAERNCTVVSHELLHELMRRAGRRDHVRAVHDTWMRHFYDGLEFEQYGADFGPTDGEPSFLTMDTSGLAP